MADIEVFSGIATLPAADPGDPELVAQYYNNGMLELCHTLASDEMGRCCCRGQVLIVAVGDDDQGMLDFGTGTTSIDDEHILGVDEQGYVVQYDPTNPDAPGRPADWQTIKDAFAQFAGGTLLEAYDSPTLYPQ